MPTRWVASSPQKSGGRGEVAIFYAPLIIEEERAPKWFSRLKPFEARTNEPVSAIGSFIIISSVSKVIAKCQVAKNIWLVEK